MSQDLESRIIELWEGLHSFEPGRGRALRFKDIAKRYPLVEAPSLQEVWMADFAEFGYCPYKAWHRGKRTLVRRPAATKLALKRGERIHAEILAEDLGKIRKAPKPTPKDLRDTKVDLLPIPEFKTKIEEGRLVYVSSVERAGRVKKNLVVTEIKTTRHELMPDHLLQVWGYCLSSPGGLVGRSDGNYKAEGVYWGLAYRDGPGEEPRSLYGPFPFTEGTFRLLKKAMSCFQDLYAGLPSETLPGPSPTKCRPCGFSWNCPWSRASEP